MIAKLLGSTSTSFQAVKYHYDKKDIDTGELLLVKNFPSPIDLSSSPELIKEYLKKVSSRSWSKQPQFHVSISGRLQNYSKKEFLALGQRFMHHHGFGKQPYLVIFHKDTSNRHIHLVSTRIDIETGKRIPSYYEVYPIGRSLHKAMEETLGISYEKKAKELLSYKTSSLEDLLLLFRRESMPGYYSRKKDSYVVKVGAVTVLSFQKEEVSLSLSNDINRLDEIRQQFEKFKELYSSKVFAVDRMEQPWKSKKLNLPKKKDTTYHSELTFKMKELFSLDLVFEKEKDSEHLQAAVIDHSQKVVYPKELTGEIVKLFTLTPDRIERNLFLSLNNYGISSERERKLLLEVYKDPNLKDFMIFKSAQRKRPSLYKDIQKEVRAFIGNPNLPGIQVVQSKADGLFYAVHTRSHYLEPLQTLVGPSLYEKYTQRLEAGIALNYHKTSEESMDSTQSRTSTQKTTGFEVLKKLLESVAQGKPQDELQKRKRKRPIV